MSEFSVSNQLNQKMQKLQELRSQYESAIKQLQTKEEELNGMWEGDARGAFKKAFGQSYQTLVKFLEMIDQYILALAETIQEYARTEQANREIAARR